MNSPKIKDGIGSWLDNAGRFPRLSAKGTNMLGRRIQALEEGNPARIRLVNKLVQHNLLLVAHSVRGYLNGGPSGRKWGCPETVDFLQVGCLGLMRAAELYDPEKGYTFATYANHWIRSKITRYGIKTRGLVQVSETMCRNIISYKRNGFLRARATGEVIADEKIVPILREAEAALSCASLNALDHFGKEVFYNIPSSSDHEDEDCDLAERIEIALDAAGVSDLGRQAMILAHGHGCTHAEIGARLGLTRNQVRTQMEKALRQARGSQELAALL